MFYWAFRFLVLNCFGCLDRCDALPQSFSSSTKEIKIKKGKQIHVIKPRLRRLHRIARFVREYNRRNRIESSWFANRLRRWRIRLVSPVGVVGRGVANGFRQNGCNRLSAQTCGTTATGATIVHSMFSSTFASISIHATMIPSVTDAIGQTRVGQSPAERMDHSMFRHRVKHSRRMISHADT